MEASRHDLEAAAEAAATPLERARAYVAVARFILVTQSASPLSDRAAAPAGASPPLQRLAADGLAFLDRASDALRRAGDGIDTEAVTDLEDRIERLRAFGEVFLCLGHDPALETSKKRQMAARHGLVVYLDDENAKIAESAELWLGVAYRLAGRPERALQVLRTTLAPPADLRIGFTARLLRCAALGDRGEHVAGLALCLRLGARVEAWFADEGPATREAARKAIRQTRVGLLRGWAGALRASGLADRARAADAEAARLIGADDKAPRVIRRVDLIESIAGLPVQKAVPGTPATQPTTSRPGSARASTCGEGEADRAVSAADSAPILGRPDTPRRGRSAASGRDPRGAAPPADRCGESPVTASIRSLPGLTGRG